MEVFRDGFPAGFVDTKENVNKALSNTDWHDVKTIVVQFEETDGKSIESICAKSHRCCAWYMYREDGLGDDDRLSDLGQLSKRDLSNADFQAFFVVLKEFFNKEWFQGRRIYNNRFNADGRFVKMPKWYCNVWINGEVVLIPSYKFDAHDDANNPVNTIYGACKKLRGQKWQGWQESIAYVSVGHITIASNKFIGIDDISKCDKGHYYERSEGLCAFCFNDEDRIQSIPSYPVGWLVCTAGHEKGLDWPLTSGYNDIGQNGVNRSGDIAHAKVFYDYKESRFYVVSGGVGSGVYLNGEPVLTPSFLHPYDEIKVSEATYVFCPLCGDQFNW